MMNMINMLLQNGRGEYSLIGTTKRAKSLAKYSPHSALGLCVVKWLC